MLLTQLSTSHRRQLFLGDRISANFSLEQKVCTAYLGLKRKRCATTSSRGKVHALGAVLSATYRCWGRNATTNMVFATILSFQQYAQRAVRGSLRFLYPLSFLQRIVSPLTAASTEEPHDRSSTLNHTSLIHSRNQSTQAASSVRSP